MIKVRILALVMAFNLFAGPVVGQDVTGRVEGRVVTAAGALVADAELILTGLSQSGRWTVQSNRKGTFQISALPVGTYRIQVRRIGFRPVVVDSVPVRLSETTSLPRIILEPTAVALPEIVVTARTAGYDPVNTSQRILLDGPRLDALPLERNFREIVLLAPSAIPSFLGRGGNRDGINVAGATGYENTYFVDGINITNPIKGESSIDLPYNFVQQIDVRVGGAQPGVPQALGGVINVVTPSGGNRWRAEGFGFFSNDALETTSRAVPGWHQTGFTYYDAGLSLSGPLLKDRIWFFGAYDHNYEQQDQTYGFGTLSDTKRQHLFAGKVTWQAGPRSSAVLTLLGDPSDSKPLASPLFGSGVATNAEVLQRTDKTRSFGLSLRGTHRVSRAVHLEGSVSHMARLEEGVPLAPGPVVIDQVEGTISGGHGSSYRFDSRRRSARLDATWESGSHSVKGGVQYDHLYGEFAIDLSRHSAGGTITRQGPTAYTWHTAYTPGGNGTSRTPSLFLHESWRPSSRLLVQAGLRWSRQDLQDAGGAAINKSYRVHDGMQPSAGIVFQPGRLGTQRLFASYSKAVEQLPIWVFQDWSAGSESLFVYTQDPRVSLAGETLEYGLVYGAGSPAEPNLRGHASETWMLGYNRSLGEGLVVTLLAMRRDLLHTVQNGLDTSGVFIWGNPGEGRLSQFPRPRRRYDALEASIERGPGRRLWYRVSYVLSRTRGNDPGLYGSDWRLGFTNIGPLYLTPEQHVNGEGLLPNDRTHVFKAFGSWAVRSGFSAGASLLVASGTPLSEYGAISIPPPFRGFVIPRGSAGRLPALWELGLRLTWDVPVRRDGQQTRVLLDVQRIGSPRRVVDREQWHYTCLDDNGDQGCPNAGYGKVTQYQRPMLARLGLMIGFGKGD